MIRLLIWGFSVERDVGALGWYVVIGEGFGQRRG